MRRKFMTSTKIAGLLVGAALVLAGCGDDGAETPSAATAAPAEAIDQATAEVTTPPTTGPADQSDDSSGDGATVTTVPSEVESSDPATPGAIVSLSPSATEMLYAIGADDRVLAVDDLSNYPPEASEKMVGLDAFTPNVEAVAGLEPDLVLTDGTNPDFLAQLDSLDIAHWEGPAAVSFDDVYAQIEQLGAATGHEAEATALVEQMEADVAEIKDDLPELGEPLTYYHELDPTYYSVTSDTFIGAVYAEIGLVNIADEAGEGNPYPQLNAEFIFEQNPDLIFLACTKYCGESAETVASRPGWDTLDAVSNGAVVEMDDDVASRWGPRIVDYLRTVGDAVAAMAPAS
jgi:iron complex transport system substrate-binding protein